MFQHKIFAVVLLAFSLLGCGSLTGKSTRQDIAQKLKVGLSKEQVIELLGTPYKTERPNPDIDSELLYYEIDILAATYCLQYMPIVVTEDKVKAWGEKFCKEPAPIPPAKAAESPIDSNLKQ